MKGISPSIRSSFSNFSKSRKLKIHPHDLRKQRRGRTAAPLFSGLSSQFCDLLNFPARKTIYAIVLLTLIFPAPAFASPNPQQNLPLAQEALTSLTILVDDFKPQAYQGDQVYPYNRLNGDRGVLNNGSTIWANGEMKITVSAGNTWTGIWESIHHPIREGLPINFSAILPQQILPAYQSQITGISVQIKAGTAGRPLRLELKDGTTIRWSNQTNLTGIAQVISRDLPALGNVNQLVIVLDNATSGDFVTIEKISFTATTQISDTATRAFAWSYGMLLANWNPITGLVRDSAKAATGEFDAIQSTGSLAAATALAEQLGVISHEDAAVVVNKIGNALLNPSMRSHGLLPHWVKVSNGTPVIAPKAEWSSIDTVIAVVGLLDSQIALGLNPSATEQMLKSIDWIDLKTPNGLLHGYNDAGQKLPLAWDTFGGESWLTAIGYSSSTEQIPPIAHPSPPTANGSGFIDELAWLYLMPPSLKDAWSTNWSVYRSDAANVQVTYYPNEYPGSCFAKLGLFGLSAGEVPNPALVKKELIYQEFGVGGSYAGLNDGLELVGAPVITPHYSAMIASQRPVESIKMWDWLISQGYFTPLNNVESLMFLPADTGCSSPVYNDLKGSWNLALQTLGWGNYLALKKGVTPAPWLATGQSSFLRKGYLFLMEKGLPLGSGLDEDGTKWQTYFEGSPTGAVNNAVSPSLDGRSLRCAISGGAPYSNVHCYRNLPANPGSHTFILNMSFFYQPASTFNNVGGASIVQALEFTVSKWNAGQRHEWALQWDNVDTGAPKWRYWGRETSSGPLKWIDLGVTGPLAGQRWHTLKLEGEILAGKVHYSRFTLDGQDHPLDITVTPEPTNESDKIAIAVQLDGNSNETPYEVFLDQVTLKHLDGASTVGVFRPSNGVIFLKNTNTPGFADLALNYGIGGDYPLVGDWDGDGDDTIGVYRGNTFLLRNANSVGFANLNFIFGQIGDQPVAGDWDGDGIDTIGVYRPSTGQFLLRNTNSAGVADMSFYLGNVGDVSIAGDWNGDGIDTTGVFRPSNGVIFLKNTNITGFADVALNYGLAGDLPVVGDWDDNGTTTIGIYRRARFYLRNSNTNGFANITFDLGIPGDIPIAGNWDGVP